ncbi:hypothetical protein QBC44DRAFT_327143 [Cladorrhinum sp. PSN332]|nr:hypothetical protein QBC44DRAFT_327143 [Cladorrhinum sp. PSN332]
MPTYPPLVPGQKFKAYGQSITWSSLHFTPTQLRPLLFTHDVLADECLSRLDTLYPPPSSSHHGDHLALLLQSRSEYPSDPILSQFWTNLTTIPSWVSLPHLTRAQKVLYRHLGPNIVGLTFQSLLGGLASPLVSSTLAQTNGFSPNTARRRLLQTFQHLLDITSSPDSILPPRGEGFLSTIRVRLLHASVRRRLLLKSQNQGPTSIPIPINDLHSLATILSFSTSLTDLSLPRQGIFLSLQEREDWLSLWRYAAHLLGCSHPSLSSLPRARAMLESIVVSELNDPSDTSKRLASNMLASLSDSPPTFPSKQFLCAQGRWLNGSELSNCLGIPNPGVYYTLLAGTQCVLFVLGHMFWKFMHLFPAAGVGERWDGMVVDGAKRVIRKRMKEMMQDTGKDGYVTDWWAFTKQHKGGEMKRKGRRGTISVEQKILVMMVLMLAGIGWVGWMVASVLMGGFRGLLPWS